MTVNTKTLEEIKTERKALAIEWAGKSSGWLTVSQVARLFGKGDSCIRRWYANGKLKGAKEDEDTPQSPVHITLESVLSRLEKFNFI